MKTIKRPVGTFNTEYGDIVFKRKPKRKYEEGFTTITYDNSSSIYFNCIDYDPTVWPSRYIIGDESEIIH